MRGGALPPALLFAAFGLALSFAPRRYFAPGIALLTLVAVPLSFFRLDAQWQDPIFLASWVSVVVAAASVHLPGERRLPLVVMLALNSGLWGGAVIAASGNKLDLLKALPLTLLCLPGRWLVTKRWQIGIKVLSSWLIAVALLAATLQLTTPTPGYLPDHID